MEINKFFDHLTTGIQRVLKADAPVSRTMTFEEFSAYAFEQIEKAKTDEAEIAKARLSCLQNSLAVAKSAFQENKLESFEIPVYETDTSDVDKNLGELESKLDSAIDKSNEEADDGAEGEGGSDEGSSDEAGESDEASDESDEEASAEGSEDSGDSEASGDSEDAGEDAGDEAEAEGCEKSEGWALDMNRPPVKKGDLRDWGRDTE